MKPVILTQDELDALFSLAEIQLPEPTFHVNPERKIEFSAYRRIVKKGLAKEYEREIEVHDSRGKPIIEKRPTYWLTPKGRSVVSGERQIYLSAPEREWGYLSLFYCILAFPLLAVLLIYVLIMGPYEMQPILLALSPIAVLLGFTELKKKPKVIAFRSGMRFIDQSEIEK